MSDYAHSYKDIDSLLRSEFNNSKTWYHKRSNVNSMLNEPNITEFHNYSLERIPIDDLVKNIDYDSLGDKDEWKTDGITDVSKFVYNPKKDTNPRDIINATRKKDGTYHINNGRHRLLALKNGGYTHAVIPIYDEAVNTDPYLKNDYWYVMPEGIPKYLRQIKAARSINFIDDAQAKLMKDKMQSRSPYIKAAIPVRRWRKK